MRPNWFIFAGVALWCLLLATFCPSPFEPEWAKLILILAVLVIIPMGQRLAWLLDLTRFASGSAFAAAYCLPQSILAGMLALPWTLFAVGTCWPIASKYLVRRQFQITEACVDCRFLFLPVGAGWAVLDRLGIRPLDFEPIIVLLTAIHFHYAGFVLPLLTGHVAKDRADVVARAVCIGVMGGVPLVAAGITATQLGWGAWLETIAVFWLATAGCGASFLLLEHSRKLRHRPVVRWLWMTSGLSLGASMILAALYGCRFTLPMGWLDIPLMRATHGTANAIVFSIIGLIAWMMEDSTVTHRAVATAPDMSCPRASTNPSSTSTSCT